MGAVVSARLLFVGNHNIDNGRNNPAKRMTILGEDVAIASYPEDGLLQRLQCRL
jgi:hypothetical protein